MKLHNKSKHPYQHTLLDEKNGVNTITINPNEIKEIPDNIAEIWLKLGEVVEYVEPAEARAKEDELLKEIEKLKAENEKLKSAGEKGETNVQEANLEALKKEADELGIQYAKNIGAAKLQEKINEAKSAGEKGEE